MAKQRDAEFKPLLYTTTVRNPERYKDFMHILKRYDGSILTPDVVRDFECDLFVCGLYRPMIVPQSVKDKWSTTSSGEFSDTPLTREEALSVYTQNDPLTNPNIKGHKEAGFAKGWESRFDTQFKLMKVLGFVDYDMGKPIRFSEIGDLLSQVVKIDVTNDSINREVVNAHLEQYVFMQSFARQQRCNPYIRELNDNIPLILLLQVINLLNADSRYNNAGISRQELPLLIFWKDNSAQALYQRICKLRDNFGFDPSDEVIIDICINEIMGGSYKKFKAKSIIMEYPDEFIRKMRLTGLITLRGAGRFIDINHLEDDRVAYILQNYSSYVKYDTKQAYFNYMSTIDSNLSTIAPIEVSDKDSARLLNNWTSVYCWEGVKSEILLLAKKQPSSDNVLRFIPAPARLEFLSALLIKIRYPHVDVIPNYPCDDEGLPTSTAGGGKGDIYCYEGDMGIIIEVTMSTGRNQTVMEIWPIGRHLEEFQGVKAGAVCYFIAPSIYTDSHSQIEFLKFSKELKIKPLSIVDFTSYLESQPTLYFD